MKLRNYTIPLALGAVFFVLGLLRLQDLSLYTDSTRYLLWANSLAELKGFVDDSLPVPSRFVMNAPLYALLLVPSQLLSPLSLTSAKVWTLLWGAFAIGLFFLWLRRSFGPRLAVAGAFVLALNPMMLVTSTEVLSEAPFIAAWIGLLALMDRRICGESSGGKEDFLLLGTLALSALLREVAMAVVAAAVLHFVSRKEHKIALATVFPAVTLYLLWLFRTIAVADADPAGQTANVQYIFRHFTTPADASLLHEFLGRLLLNLRGYCIEIGPLLFYPFPDLVAEPSSLLQALAALLSKGRVLLLLVFLPLVVVGMILDVRTSPSAFFRVLSIAFYLLILLFYPVHDLRFLLPLLPLGLFFILRSCSWLWAKLSFSKTSSIAIFAAGSFLLLFPNVVCDLEIIATTIAYRNDPPGFSSKFLQPDRIPRYYRRPWSAAGEWIKTTLPAGAVIASPAKEIAPFAGSHKVLELSRTVPTPVFERMLRDHDAAFLVTFTLWGDFKSYEFQMNESRRFRFDPFHQVGDLFVLRVRPAMNEQGPRPEEQPPLAAEPKAADYLRFGRYDFMNLRYSGAVLGFTLARNEEPRQPEPYFHLLVVFSATADSAGALLSFQGLSRLPESTPFMPLAQVHINLMRLLRGASGMQIPLTQSTMATDAAITCWNLGYPRLSYRIASNVIKLDSTFFNAHLWASHFARQMGDTLLSYRHLRKLEIIDKTAPIVKDFVLIRHYEDSLRKTRVVAKKVRYHRSLSLLYDKLELLEEALDEIERGLLLEPQNVELLLDRAQMFDRKGALYAAQKTYEGILELQPDNEVAREKLKQR